MTTKNREEQSESLRERIVKEYNEFKNKVFITLMSGIVSFFIVPYINIFNATIIFNGYILDISKFLDYLLLVLLTYCVIKFFIYKKYRNIIKQYKEQKEK